MEDKREVQLQKSCTIIIRGGYIAPQGGGLVHMMPDKEIEVRAGDWLDLGEAEKGIIAIRKREDSPEPPIEDRRCRKCESQEDLTGTICENWDMNPDGTLRELFTDSYYYECASCIDKRKKDILNSGIIGK